MSLTRREALKIGVGTIAALAVPVSSVAAMTRSVAAAETIPAWVVGTPGEFDWQHIIAKTEREAIRIFACDAGNDDFEEECDHKEYRDGCDCCEALSQFDAERKPMWDGKPEGQITAGDWMRSGTGHICSRCSYETFPGEGGHGVGAEAVCSECMTLADWDIIDPEHATELRAQRSAP